MQEGQEAALGQLYLGRGGQVGYFRLLPIQVYSGCPFTARGSKEKKSVIGRQYGTSRKASASVTGIRETETWSIATHARK